MHALSDHTRVESHEMVRGCSQRSSLWGVRWSCTSALCRFRHGSGTRRPRRRLSLGHGYMRQRYSSEGRRQAAQRETFEIYVCWFRFISVGTTTIFCAQVRQCNCSSVTVSVASIFYLLGLLRSTAVGAIPWHGPCSAVGPRHVGGYRVLTLVMSAAASERACGTR
jgi:hypothetical protein